MAGVPGDRHSYADGKIFRRGIQKHKATRMISLLKTAIHTILISLLASYKLLAIF
jgi:hypothetical protein